MLAAAAAALDSGKAGGEDEDLGFAACVICRGFVIWSTVLYLFLVQVSLVARRGMGWIDLRLREVAGPVRPVCPLPFVRSHAYILAAAALQ